MNTSFMYRILDGLVDHTPQFYWKLLDGVFNLTMDDPGFESKDYEANLLGDVVRIKRSNKQITVYLPYDSDPKTLNVTVSKGQILITVTQKKWKKITVQ